MKGIRNFIKATRYNRAAAGMVQDSNKIKLFALFLAGILVSCSQYKGLLNKEGGEYEAIENSIIDYYHTNKDEINRYEVFHISIKTNDELYHKFDILPEENVFSVLDTLGSFPSYFPTNYKYYNNKLFVWNDRKTPLSQEIINVLYENNILDSIRLRYETGVYGDDWESNRKDLPSPPLFKVDELLEGIDYVICKKNIRRYVKLKTSEYIPPDSEKLPKIECF